MKDNISPPNFGTAPQVYEKQYFDRLLRSLEVYLSQSRDVGPVHVSRINIIDLPTSSVGLRSGDIWADSGTLKVVP